MTWETRQTRLETNWESFRANLAYYAICQEALTFPQHCSKCSVELDQCVVRCLDCGPGVLFCSECDMQAHDQNPIHEMEREFFQSRLPTEGFDSQGKLVSVGKWCSNINFNLSFNHNVIFRYSQIYYCFIFIKIRISKEMHFQLYIPRYVNVVYVIVYIHTVYTVFTTISIAALIKFFASQVWRVFAFRAYLKVVICSGIWGL